MKILKSGMLLWLIGALLLLTTGSRALPVMGVSGWGSTEAGDTLVAASAMKDDAAAPGLPATGSATSVYAGASETTFDIYDPYGHFFGAPAVEQSVPGHLTAWYFVQPDSRVFSQTQYGLERTASIGGSLEVDVPEPDIVILLGLGLAGVALARISRKRHQRRNGIA